MKKIVVFAALVLAALPARAQDRLADQLRKGVVEEETGKNLDKAIQAYQSVVAQYDAERKTAGTALFRLAECYRKAGKRDQAVAAYQRVLREFFDQAGLTEPSRKQLASFGIDQPASTPSAVARARDLADARASEAAPVRSREVAEARARDVGEGRDRGYGTNSQLRASESSLKVTELQMNAMAKRLAEAKTMVEKGTMTRADLEKLELELNMLNQAHRQQVEELRAYELQVQKQRALNEAMTKSIQAEIVLVQERISLLKQKVAVGQVAREDPELLQLQRELLGLQRKLDELKLDLVR